MTSRRQARGGIHPGLLAAGLLIALGLAWWLASSSPPADRTTLADPPTAGHQADAAPPTATRDRDQAANTDNEGKPLYRWTDAAGVVHFTDVPPTDRPFVQVDVNPDRNVVKFPAPPEP